MTDTAKDIGRLEGKVENLGNQVTTLFDKQDLTLRAVNDMSERIVEHTSTQKVITQDMVEKFEDITTRLGDAEKGVEDYKTLKKFGKWIIAGMAAFWTGIVKLLDTVWF